MRFRGIYLCATGFVSSAWRVRPIVARRAAKKSADYSLLISSHCIFF